MCQCECPSPSLAAPSISCPHAHCFLCASLQRSSHTRSASSVLEAGAAYTRVITVWSRCITALYCWQPSPPKTSSDDSDAPDGGLLLIHHIFIIIIIIIIIASHRVHQIYISLVLRNQIFCQRWCISVGPQWASK